MAGNARSLADASGLDLSGHHDGRNTCHASALCFTFLAAGHVGRGLSRDAGFLTKS